MIKRRKYYLDDFGFLCATKRDFTVKKSRYSDVISIDDDCEVKPTTYTDKRSNNGIFHILKKVKKELEPHVSEINDFMKGKRFDYHSITDNFGSFCCDKVSNIDLNSAYLTSLNRDGLLGNELTSKINDLPKEDRLKVLGLLAYEPDCFQFKNGEPYRDFSQPNKFKQFFFYAVYQVSELMKEIRSILGDHFIFFWVDGVYFFDQDFLNELVFEIIEKNGFKSTFEALKKFNYNLVSEKNIKIDFENDQGRTKKFIVDTNYQREKMLYGRALKKYLNEKTVENFENLLLYQK